MTHPSYLTLDRYSLEPHSQPAEVATHVGSCPRCQAHVARLAAVVTPSTLVLRENERAMAPPTPTPRPLTFALSAAAALLLGAVLVVALAERPNTAETTSPKSARPPGTPPNSVLPGVELWVKTPPGEVSLWHGQTLHAGDAIRVQVQPAKYNHVVVVELRPPHPPRVLYEAAADGSKSALLSPAWAIDDQPTGDLEVILSVNALRDEQLASLPCQESAAVWCKRFSLTPVDGRSWSPP